MFPGKLLSSFEAYSESHAFCINGECFTYSQLGKIVGSIQRKLQFDGNKKLRVGIIFNEDIYTYASLLAIWLSGHSYVPISKNSPVDRNLRILSQANVDLVISTSGIADEAYNGLRIIHIDETVTEDVLPFLGSMDSRDLAYILFTSGSTGEPKGVPISFANLDAFTTAFDESGFHLVQGDKCLQMFDLTFDVSISSFLPALLKGACVFTLPPDTSIKYLEVLKLTSRHSLTALQIVPSIIKLSKPFLQKLEFPSVTKCILTGEATEMDLLEDWKRVIPNAAIYNFYGPTEATIYCSSYRLQDHSSKSYNNLMAIGKPLKGMSFLLVSEDNEIIKYPNTRGELLIRGEQVTKGYLNADNAGPFVNISDGGGSRLYYRSGDICFFDEEGDYYYCGRTDGQVKLQGFRVELREIEVVVRKECGFNNFVTTSKNDSGINQLDLFIEAKADEGKLQNILDHLRSKLPPYMIPSKVYFIDSFPLTTSGKTDKSKCKSLVG